MCTDYDIQCKKIFKLIIHCSRDRKEYHTSVMYVELSRSSEIFC